MRSDPSLYSLLWDAYLFTSRKECRYLLVNRLFWALILAKGLLIVNVLHLASG